MPKKIVLLGDSVFDNKPYVPKGKDVVSVLQSDRRTEVHSFARDGSQVRDTQFQVGNIHLLPDLPHAIVVSVGGNNFVPLLDFEGMEVSRTAFDAAMLEFQNHYSTLLSKFKFLKQEQDVRVLVFNVYNPFPKEFPMYDQVCSMLVDVNAKIEAISSGFGYELVDVHELLSGDPTNFVEIIEPSAKASNLISKLILDRVFNN